MQPKTISATSYNTYKNCPFSWSLKYKHNCLQLSNKAFSIGTAFHKGVEKFHSGRLIEHIIEDLKGEILNGKETTPEQVDDFGLIRQMVEAYARNPVNYPTIATEYQFNIPVFGVKAPLFGFIDRIVDGGVVEYKTSAKDYTIDDIQNIQSEIYSYAYRQKYEKMPRVTYCILNKSKVKRSDYRPQILEITLPESSMQDLIKKLTIFEDRINRDLFDPTPGTHCNWCGFRDSGCNYYKYGN